MTDLTPEMLDAMRSLMTGHAPDRNTPRGKLAWGLGLYNADPSIRETADQYLMNGWPGRTLDDPGRVYNDQPTQQQRDRSFAQGNWGTYNALKGLENELEVQQYAHGDPPGNGFPGTIPQNIGYSPDFLRSPQFLMLLGHLIGMPVTGQRT